MHCRKLPADQFFYILYYIFYITLNKDRWEETELKGSIQVPKRVFVAHFRHWIAVACSNASDSLSITKVPLEAMLQKMRVDDSHAQTSNQT